MPKSDTDLTELDNSILTELSKKSNQKASDLSRLIGVDRREINQRLYKMKSRVQQNSEYRWSLVAVEVRANVKDPTLMLKKADSDWSATQIEPSGPQPRVADSPVFDTTDATEQKSDALPESLKRTVREAPTTEIGRLCRYYLEAVGHDYADGVSTFASSSFGDLKYAELPSVPLVGNAYEWWFQPNVERLLRSIRADRGGAVAWFGYPVRLREHKTAKWSGFFVEPVLLWAIEESSEHRAPIFGDEIPTPNFAFLKSVALGDLSALSDEALRLDTDLGLGAPIEERPEIDEILYRLPRVRTDWDWREELDPENCTASPPLSELKEGGIYNKAIVIAGRRSPFTQGLEAELKNLGDLGDDALAGTALGSWLAGDQSDGESDTIGEPLLEVLPMNTEQRAAVESALRAKHTLVTGPPGTGKSQVVTNLIINAAWRGQKVLFASKNNKAVDVVEARVNGLGNRPVLLRLGSKEYQQKLSEYLTSMLSGVSSDDDEVSYRETSEQHSKLLAELSSLDQSVENLVALRNRVDELEKKVELDRELLGADKFNSLNSELFRNSSIVSVSDQLRLLDTSRMGFLSKIAYSFSKSNRRDQLLRTLNDLSKLAEEIDVQIPEVNNELEISDVLKWHQRFIERLDAAKRVDDYQKALGELTAGQRLEILSSEKQKLIERIASSSLSLWKSWVTLAPARLPAEDRKKMADYVAVLQLLVSSDAQSINSTIRAKAKRLQGTVSEMFSCWAVTSLSARGKVPFEPAHFDVVVIDEASQCDIASALPLLYRAKRSVIIGDPKQLRHISAITASRDSDLQAKYGLVDDRLSWMYSVCSLYDVAASVASSDQIINLRDHHRCHSDIIEFSNKIFYEDKLRVATKYSSLRRPSKGQAGVLWSDVSGRVTRPSSGGALNQPEAVALITALEDLLITRGYQGSVGVVTPFRAQAELIQTLVGKSEALSAIAPRVGLLIDTVHKFQGDERDVIFFSTVISAGTAPGAIGFLANNGNLFNVAITRARGLLHVVGDRTYCGSCGVDYLEKFVGYVSKLDVPKRASLEDIGSGLGRSYPTVAKPERVSDWERLLYVTLFDAGIKCVPQYSVEQYELDFALFVGERKLNIEVDGERYHRSWTGELSVRDQLRNLRLIELGWDVRRFWVYELRDRMPDCVASIRKWIDDADGN